MDVLEFIAIAEAMNMQAVELLKEMRNALPETISL